MNIQQQSDLRWGLRLNPEFFYDRPLQYELQERLPVWKWWPVGEFFAHFVLPDKLIIQMTRPRDDERHRAFIGAGYRVIYFSRNRPVEEIWKEINDRG